MDPILEYYNQVAGIYDHDRFSNSYGKFIHQQEIALLDKWIKNKNEIIVDMGCGTGRMLPYASIGIDGSSEMLKIARKKYPEKQFYLADAADVPLPDEAVDTILAFHLFMHLDNKKLAEILRECDRILKPGGRIIFDIISLKRRNLMGYKPGNGWHSSNSNTIKGFACFVHPEFKIRRYSGILFLPFRKIPRNLRKITMPVDTFLTKSCLKEYSTYLLIELVKE